MNPKFILYAVIVVLTIITTIGFAKCEHNFKNNKTEKALIEKDITIIDIESNKDGDTNQAIEPVSLGEFKLTAYCPCAKCCGKWAYRRPNGIVYGAAGEELKEGYSIAVDPNIIPYGTEVVINEHTYKAQDCGGAIKGNRIDVYFKNHDDALEFGVKYAEVFINSQK